MELITHMNNGNGFDLMVSVVFAINTQFKVIGPKPYYLVTSLTLEQVNISAYFHLCDLFTCNKVIMMKKKLD